jgi:hypothetical protein
MSNPFRENRMNGGGQKLVFNGIDGDTGDYAIPPTTPAGVLDMLRGRPPQEEPTGKGTAYGVDPHDLSSAGWGVVFPRGCDPAIREALTPLLKLREVQASRVDARRFRVLWGDEGLQPNESKGDFLHRYGAGRGPVEPKQMPYYLLLVGGPEAIPFEFQYLLDVQHAVGRIAFDTPWEYAQYAESVVAAEAGGLVRPRRVALLGTANPDDPATALSSARLVRPLGESLAATAAGRGWEVTTHVGDDGATKAGFARHLGGDRTPALLFTASHGVSWDPGSPCQRSRQGALLCQDWPGRKEAPGPLARDHYFAAGDVAGDATVGGLMAFFFACYGAGTPLHDDFARPGGSPRRLAPAPLVARLPQRLLGHPRGGALAVVGHVERAWTYSIEWGAAAQTAVFESMLSQLLDGVPVGAAMEDFAQRYGELATELVAAGEPEDGAPLGDTEEFLELWTAHHDARNYVLLGDPGVRLAVPNAGGDA